MEVEADVVETTLEVVVVAIAEVVWVATSEVVVIVFIAVVVVEFDVEQDAKITDITVRITSPVNNTVLFNISPLYFCELSVKIYDLTVLTMLKLLSIKLNLPLTPITSRAPTTGGDFYQLSCESYHKLSVPWIPLVSSALCC
jgi:hypothetical protein